MSTDKAVSPQLPEAVREQIDFLRAEAAQATKEIASRVDMANTERAGTEEDNEAARLMAERMSGRPIPRRTAAERQRGAQMHDRIAEKYRQKRVMLEKAADTIERLEAAEAVREQEMNTRQPISDEESLSLVQTMDGQTWANAFCRATGFPDEGWALTWFCNAIMAGYDHATRKAEAAAQQERARLAEALRLATEATNGWACYAKRKIEHNDIARLHREISAVASHPPPTPEDRR